MSAAPTLLSRELPMRRALRERDRSAVLLAVSLGAALLLRVLTDDRSAANSRHSGSLDLSALLAGIIIVAAVISLLQRREGVRPAAIAASWLAIWTAIAVSTHGATGETLREGVREASVVAVAVVAYNARAVLSVAAAARLLQLIALIPAAIAIYQLASHSGMDVGGQLRANGTLAHPDSAAMFFALAALAASWSYLDDGRHLLDAVSLVVFATALIATFSIGGAVTLSVTLVAFGLLRRGPRRDRLLALIVAVAVLAALFATPLGAHRLSRESSTSLATEQRGEPNTSLAWRLHKWKLLRAEWERSPVFGRGLGSTVTAEGIPGNRYAGEPPHNEYIRYLVETGIVGSALLLWGLVVLTLRLVGIRRSAARSDRRAFNEGALAIGAVIGCLVNSLAGNTLLNSPTCYAAALIVFAVLGSAARRRTAPTIA